MAADENSPFGSIANVFRWVKVGPGIVGRNVPVAIAVVAVFGLGIWRLQSEWMIMAVLGGTGLLAAAYFAVVFWYATRFPDFSTLDGASLVEYRRTQMASNDAPVLDLSQAQITANTSPQIELVE